MTAPTDRAYGIAARELLAGITGIWDLDLFREALERRAAEIYASKPGRADAGRMSSAEAEGRQARDRLISLGLAIRGHNLPVPGHKADFIKAIELACAALATRPAAVGGELPELPEPVERVRCVVRGLHSEVEPMDDYYTATQMRAYGQAYARTVIAASCEGLLDPATVHVNMLRGTIARPTWRNIVDLMGEVPNGEERQLARIAELQHELAELRATQPQQLAVTDEAVERLAKYIYAQEARKYSTLEAFNQHMRNWPRALPEARAMLNAALPHLARKETTP